VTTRHAEPAARPRRHLSYLTCEWSVELDYAALTDLMDHVFDLWDMLNLDATDEKIGDGFSALVEHIARLRDFTGWGGVPGKYLR
jgi:hypothetical protein